MKKILKLCKPCYYNIVRGFMDDVLKKLIEIYEPGDTDWMMNKVSKKNPYTYHHIQEERNDGERTLENGAILTRKSHEYLNYLARKQKGNYQKLNKLFQELNDTKMPPTDDYYQKVLFLLEKTVQEDDNPNKMKHAKEKIRKKAKNNF